MKRIFLMWGALGALYVTIEVLWRGFSHPSMLVVGGICGVLVGAINQVPGFYEKLSVRWQSIIGAIIVLAVEFAAGCIVNLWLGWGVWDYSHMPLNLCGQICLLYGFLWVLLMPLAIWAEDTARWLFYAWAALLVNAGAESVAQEAPPAIPPYTLRSIYKELFVGNKNSARG